MKTFKLSELKEFAAILKTDGKDAMLGNFKSWYRATLYEFCRRELICNILRGYYGSVEAEWKEVDALAEQNYRQDTQDALTDLYERYRKEWFETQYQCYEQQRHSFAELKKNFKWYRFVKLWYEKIRLNRADRSLTLRDILQVVSCVYVQKGGKLSAFKLAMSA